MKKFLYVTFAFLLLTSVVAADPASDARQAIGASYARADEAAGKRDAAGTLSIFGKDGILISEKDEKKTPASELPGRQEMFDHMTTVHSTTTINDFNLVDDLAKVKVTAHFEGQFLDPETKKPSTLVVDETDEDDWSKTDEGWRVKTSRTLSSRGMVDGKVMQH